MKSKYLNKVNIITLSRIFLTIIGVLLIFSGNIKLLVIAYVIMSLSEVSDIIDGYVARRDKLVTDLGKILDPLSDSISRFFYFFALAYHGLFPIWFIVFFFLRDIVVAYVRIFASFSGKVMSARFSGKLKGAVQFGGQYLLMFALMINTIQEGGSLSNKFLFWSLGIGVLLNVIVVVYFRIKGALLAIILILMVVLGGMLFSLNHINFSINYLTTFSISFLVISVTLYSLVDYLFSLEPSVKSIYKYIASTMLISMMFFISPYFLDLVINKIESDAKSGQWISNEDIDIEQVEKLKIKGIVTVDDKIVIAATEKDKLSRFYVYEDLDSGFKSILKIDLPGEMSDIQDIEFIGSSIYVIDDSSKKVFEIDKDELMNNSAIKILNEYDTGFTSSATLAVAKFNKKNYLVINDYIFSGHMYFSDIETLKDTDNIKDQMSFRIKSEFYVKNLYCEKDNLFVLVNKLSKDLIYRVDLEKAVYSGSLQNGIIDILEAPDNNLKGVSLLNGKIISYGSRSKKVYLNNFITE